MLTIKTIMSQIQEGDWFVTIDLKYAYFHIQVVQRHRRFLQFAFGGKAYQYNILGFGLALAPRTFTKCMDAALAPLRLQGIRVLNYLDDWLILAHSRELVTRHRDIVLRHIHSLGLRMNAKKCVLRSQVVTLHSFHPPPFASCEDERLHLLCPVRALKLYLDRSKVWRKSSQLLVCFGAGRRGLATSKQRISHWVRDAISLAYKARNLPSPFSLRAHSTRGVASSQALFRGVPLEDICVAAGWSSPHTFVKFYNLDVDRAPGSQDLVCLN